jgi:undecaprenyl phosphate N,N'-diacetylbacillosamine 1-phosphate transferase
MRGVNNMKRSLDVFFSVIFLIIFLPLMFFFAFLIILESPGPILYKQERIGRNGIFFMLYKLRSMKINKYRVENQIYESHPDLTKIGKLIRRFKIDEMPQLFNVLKGDMSLVGPRPCLPSLLDKFDENAYYRLRVRPGLTGWAQINGNIYNSWQKRFELDRYYVENQSILFDFRIILGTFRVLIFGDKV